MIRSMTGYGMFRGIVDNREITVEIKSVNHRYFDFQCYYPRAYGYLETHMKSFIASMVQRGKINVSISIYTLEDRDIEITIDQGLARNYIDGLRKIKDDLNLSDDLKLSSLIRIKDIFSIKKDLPDEEVIWSSVKQVAEKAVENFLVMSEKEGEELKVDILSRIEIIDNYVAKIEKLAPASISIYQENLYNKLRELLDSENIDEQRILTEAAIFSDKTAVDEETVRLISHLGQIRDLLVGDDELTGRKMDFIVQEINREINTIGSKSQNLDISKIVVDTKSEIEKIREQIQNII